MKGRFVLRGPQDGTEGGNGSKQQPIEQRTAIKQRPVNHDRTISGSIMELNPPEPISVTEPNMDTLLVNMLENDAGIDLLNELRGQYREDPMFKSVLDRPKDFRNFEVKNDLIYLKLDGKNLLCIPKMMLNGRSIYKIIISEAHSILAHLGAAKTLSYLRDHVWWKEMVSDTKAYCETCITCKRSKPNNQKPYGLLNPLSIPSEPWESIGVDFVGPLPTSRN